MNRRIQELFKQAGGKTSVRNLTSSPIQVVETHELWDDHIDKFAELIVKECVALMNSEKEYYSKPGSYESREYYERYQAKEDAFDDAAQIIKSHFGVE